MDKKQSTRDMEGNSEETGLPIAHNIVDPFEYDGIVWPGGNFSAEIFDELKQFQFTKDDVLLQSYPRSGTTWSTEIVYMILHDANISKAKSAPIDDRVPFLETGNKERKSLNKLKAFTPPYFVKSHVPVHFFEKQVRQGRPKTIFVCRNPKDTLVSYYNFHKMVPMLGNYDGTFDHFMELVYNKQTTYGDWFDFTCGWLKVKDEHNVLVVTYEEMKRDITAAVHKLADFLERTLTEEQIKIIVQHTSFASMKDNPATNYEDFAKRGIFDYTKGKFIRKGEIGGWKEVFSVSQNERFDAYIKDRMKDCDFEFIYE